MTGGWVAGINAVEMALRERPEQLGEVWLERGSRNPRLREIEALARGAGVSVRHLARAELDRASAGVRHQGCAARLAAVTDQAAPDLGDLLAAADQDAFFLVLDGVTDPHNLGACLRSAAAAGVHAVIVPRDRAAGLTPVVRKVASGGAERVPLVQVTNLARSLRELRQAGVWLTGLAGDAEQALWDLDLRGPVALVLGGEGGGLRRLTREGCDHLALIPMPGGMESLNVSVAAGIALFEVVRQRGRP